MAVVKANNAGTNIVSRGTTAIVKIGNSFVAITATMVSVADAGGYYDSTNVEGVLQEIGQTLAGNVNELEPAIAQQATPPGSPATGDRYLVSAVATGAWAGQEDSVAEWDGASWAFTAPAEDDIIYITSTLTTLRYTGTAWVEYIGVAVLQNGNEVGTGGLRIGTTNTRALRIITDNTERVVVNSNGNVLVNEGSTGLRLEVGGRVVSKQYDTDYQTLTYGASVAWDIQEGAYAVLTLTGGATLSNPTNANSIAPTLECRQDATGGHVLAFDSNYVVNTSAVTTEPNSVTIYSFVAGSDGTIRGVGQTFAS